MWNEAEEERVIMAMKGLSKESMKPMKVKHIVIKTIRRFQSPFNSTPQLPSPPCALPPVHFPPWICLEGSGECWDVRMLPEFYFGWNQVGPTDVCTLVSPAHGALFCNVSDLIFKPSPVRSLFYLLGFRWWKIFSWIVCMGSLILNKVSQPLDSPVRCFHLADKVMFFSFSFLTSPTSTFIPESNFRALWVYVACD